MVNKLRRDKESLKSDSERMLRDLKFHYNRMKRLQREIKLSIHSIHSRYFMWECFTFVMVGWLAVTIFRLFHNVFLAVFLPVTLFLFVWNSRTSELDKVKSHREKAVLKSVEDIVEHTVLYIQGKLLIHSRLELRRLKEGIRRALTTSNKEFMELQKREIYWKEKWEAQFRQQEADSKLRRDIESSLNEELKRKDEIIGRQNRVIGLGDIECKLAVDVAKENKMLKKRLGMESK